MPLLMRVQPANAYNLLARMYSDQKIVKTPGISPSATYKSKTCKKQLGQLGAAYFIFVTHTNRKIVKTFSKTRSNVIHFVIKKSRI